MNRSGLRWRNLILCGACLLIWANSSYSAEDVINWDMGGYTKCLVLYYRQYDEDVWINLERLRLDFDLNLAQKLQLKLIYDNELILAADIGENRLVDSSTFWDLDKDIARRDDLLWQHSIYRAYARFYTDTVEITVGRQRVAWGVARLWNPIDLFNPISPQQIEGDEKLGIDAVNLELHLGDLSSLQLVFAPQDEHEEQSAALRYKTTIGEYDLALMAGEFRDDEVLGVSFDGYIGGAGIRGEITYTNDSVSDDFTRAVIGGDYTFPNSIYVLIEYLYNGGTVDDIEGLSLQSDSSQIITREENFLGFGLGYELTPLIRLNNYTIYDIDEDSLFIGPTLSYSIIEDLDLRIGAQLFSGRNNSEFGNLPDIYYTQLQWFF